MYPYCTCPYCQPPRSRYRYNRRHNPRPRRKLQRREAAREEMSQAQELTKHLILTCDERIRGKRGLSSPKIAEVIRETLRLKVSVSTIWEWRKKIFREGEPLCGLSPGQKLTKQLILNCDERIIDKRGFSSPKIARIIRKNLGLNFPTGTIDSWRKGKKGSILFGEEEEPFCFTSEQKLTKQLILNCDERIMGRVGPSNQKISDFIWKIKKSKVAPVTIYGWRVGHKGKPGILFGKEGEPFCFTPEQKLTKQLILNCDKRIIDRKGNFSSPKIAKVIKEALGSKVGANTIMRWRAGSGGKTSILFGEEGESSAQESCGLTPEKKLTKQLILNCDERIIDRRGHFSNLKIAKTIKETLGSKVSVNSIRNWRPRGKRKGILFGKEGEPDCKRSLPKPTCSGYGIPFHQAPIHGKGLCRFCYRKMRTATATTTCPGYQVPKHQAAIAAKGLCAPCYARKRRTEIRTSSIHRRRRNPRPRRKLQRREEPSQMSQEEKREKARELYLQGVSINETARRLRAGRPNIHKWIEDLISNVDPRREKARELYLQGVSIRQISRRLLAAPETINKWISDLIPDVDPRREEARELYQQGVGIHEIRQRLRADPKTIKKWIEGIEPPEDPRREKARDLYQQGVSIEEMQRSLRAAYTTITKWVEGLERPVDPRIKQARELYKQGVGVMEIKRRLPVKFETINKWIADLKSDVDPRIEKARKLYQQGVGIMEISRRLRAANRTSKKWIKDLIPDVDPRIEEARELYRQGVSVNKMTRLLRASSRTINKWISDLRQNPRPRRKLQRREDVKTSRKDKIALARKLYQGCDPEIMYQGKPSLSAISHIVGHTGSTITRWMEQGLLGPETDCGKASQIALAKKLYQACDPRIMGRKGPNSALISKVVSEELGLNNYFKNVIPELCIEANLVID